jgi:RNA polymerase sigma-70 factor (ECF subfamily)
VELQDQGPTAPTSRRGPSCEPQRTTLEQRLEHELERLYRDEARDLRRFLIGNRINPAEADELVNAAFLGVHRAMERKAGPLDVPRAYLYKVAINMMQRLRQRNLGRRSPEDRVQQLEQAEARLHPPDDTTNVDDRDELACLSALDHLPVRQRQAFLLRHYFGFYPEEIATVMGIKVDTVDTHLERARHKLADLVGKEEAP